MTERRVDFKGDRRQARNFSKYANQYSTLPPTPLNNINNVRPLAGNYGKLKGGAMQFNNDEDNKIQKIISYIVFVILIIIIILNIFVYKFYTRNSVDNITKIISLTSNVILLLLFIILIFNSTNPEVFSFNVLIYTIISMITLYLFNLTIVKSGEVESSNNIVYIFLMVICIIINYFKFRYFNN